MIPTIEQLTELLPPFRDERILIKENQRVKDILKQLLIAHEKYAVYYDKFCMLFYDKSTLKICENICEFLKKNIKYVEESEDDQTTALPTAILEWRQGDCKHYASFTASILDAISRKTGKKIDWVYRFASYDLLIKSPHHVFVVVFTKDDEIWIDPVPGADKLTPVWQVDETVNINSMALHDVVGSIPDQATNENTIGWTLGQQITHAAAKVTMAVARGAFLSMLTFNVRAWASNLQHLLDTDYQNTRDNIGTKWYLMGGDWSHLEMSIKTGSTKKMIGSLNNSNSIGEPLTAASITAMIAAATPVILAIVPIIKKLVGSDEWEPGQMLPGMTTNPTTGLPVTSTTGTTDLMTWIKANPVPVIAALGIGAYLLLGDGKKKKVNGSNDNTLLLVALAAGAILLFKNKGTTTDTTTDALIAIPDDVQPLSNPFNGATSYADSNEPFPTVLADNSNDVAPYSKVIPIYEQQQQQYNFL